MSRAQPRLDLTIVLAVLLPIVTVVALALVRPELAADSTRPPTETDLTRSLTICPSGSERAFLTSGSDAGGTVNYVIGDRDGSVEVTPGEVATVTGGNGPLVARADGKLAAGLIAARFGSPLASAECRAPAADQWFTGVASGARHTSVLELVNPDAGPAVVDVTLYGNNGVVDTPRLRGVAVPGRGVVRLSLGELIPRRDELALHVTTSRGRVTASVRDRYQQLGTGGAAEDWLPAQDAPITSNLLLGVATGSGLRTLVLLNPSDDETRAQVRLVSKQAVFSPAGLEEISLAPQSVTRVSMTKLLRDKATEGTLGLLVTSPAPITASLRSYVGGDLSHAVGATPIDVATTVIAPPGKKQVVVAESTQAGVVTVTARSLDGEVVAEKRIEVIVGRGFVIDLPAEAELITVTPLRTEVTGAILVSSDTLGGGAAVVRLRAQVTSGLIGSVRPGLP